MSGGAGADNFVKKLADLSPTSVSIQSLSKWCALVAATAVPATLLPGRGRSRLFGSASVRSPAKARDGGSVEHGGKDRERAVRCAVPAGKNRCAFR